MPLCEARRDAANQMVCRRCVLTWDMDDPAECGRLTDDPINKQVGGASFKVLTIEPVEFALKNGWDFAAGSALKYLTQWRTQNGVEDLRKARHFIELRAKFLTYLGPMAPRTIPMNRYLAENLIAGDDWPALLLLESWVRVPPNTMRQSPDGLYPAERDTRGELLQVIDALISKNTETPIA